MEKNKINSCVGCENIRNTTFPFNKETTQGKKGFFINTEGCGKVQDESDYFLQIFYCPVCGIRLKPQIKLLI